MLKKDGIVLDVILFLIERNQKPYMKVICEKNNIFQTMIGEQDINVGTYRKMKYVITIKRDDFVLAYNSVSCEMICLYKNESLFIEANSTSNINEITTYLIKNYFLVPNDFSDEKFFINYFNTVKLFDVEKGINFYKILTTNDCNARCHYCYKLDVNRQTMTPDITNSTLNYIINNHTKKVHLYWFGGEPLLNTKTIDTICTGLSENKIDFKSSMITNGFLFDENLVKKALRLWNLNFVQITLDGTEEKHNKTKSYIYKNVNAFQITLNNIELLLKQNIKLFIRLNIDSHNINDLYVLIEQLINKFSKYHNFKIYPALLSLSNSNTTFSYNEQECFNYYNNFIQLRYYLLAKGVLAQYNLPHNIKTNSCMADSDHSVVVLPDGKLSLCDLEAENSVYSDIFYSQKNIDIISDWKKLKKFSENCVECNLYAHCVKLNKCPEEKNNCNNYTLKVDLQTLEIAMLEKYNDFLLKEGK